MKSLAMFDRVSTALSLPSFANELPWDNKWFIVSIAALFCLIFAIAFSLVYSAVYKFNQKRKRSVDDVTGLMSMEGMESVLNHRYRHKKNSRYLLTEMNVRDFANVNRLYGSKDGDEILKSIAHNLKEQFESDEKQGKPVLLARGYADNFYILQSIVDENEAITHTELLQNNIQEKVGRERNVHIVLKSGSIVCRSDENHAINLKDAISKAGYARRKNQESMVDNFALYDGSMQTQHENEERIENGIESAIRNRELMVMYQPKINLATGKIEGAEALIRWKTKNNALIPPSVFIPVLERNGMVGVMDEYVYRTVFKFLKRLGEENIPQVKISMNMSRLNNNCHEFVKQLDILQEQYQVDKKYIELEIEERFAGAGDDFVCELIHCLHDSGYKVSMDDFGSGQSSLNMLSEMPVDIVKFDQRFLKQAEYSRDARVILAYMIKMVNELGKETLCEGVETLRHVKILQKCGCSLAQGYYYSRPIPEDEFKQFILDHI